MIAGAYLRVSTNDQDLASQKHVIEEWARANPQYEIRWFMDHGISGTKDTRPGLQELVKASEVGEIQAVVCYSLDRVSRTAATALQLVLRWLQLDVEFFSVSQAILQLGKDNPLRLTITSLFAELAALEREAIVGRVRAGLAAAKARGVKLGNDQKLTPDQIKLAKQLRHGGMSCRALGVKFGVSAATISRRT